MALFRILVVGDVVGQPGRDALRRGMSKIVRSEGVHFTVVNIENAAGGFGITTEIYEELLTLPIDVMSSGNHIYAKRQFVERMDQCVNLIRPLNFPQGSPGVGYCTQTIAGKQVMVINLIGRVFMGLSDCPFQVVNQFLDDLETKPDIILVDFHAEATSEKQAMGWHLDGKVSAVFGTHTHVQTADARCLKNGTAYITDIGMTGARDSIIGMQKNVIVQRFHDQVPIRFYPEENSVTMINGIILDIDTNTNQVLQIKNVWEEFS